MNICLCVCVCAKCVCQRALLHPVALQTVLVREGGRGKSGFLLLLWAEFEGAQICACKMNGLLVYVLSPPETRQVTLLNPEFSLFPTLRKNPTVTVHPTNNPCTLGHAHNHM